MLVSLPPVRGLLRLSGLPLRLLPMPIFVIGLSLAAAQAQPFVNQGTCPPNHRASGAFCVITLAGSIRNPGTCPPEYVSTDDGAYCVLAPRNQ